MEHQRTKRFVESEVNWEGILYYRKSATDPTRDFSKKWSANEALNLNLLHDDYLCGQVPQTPPTTADADAAKSCMAEIVLDASLASFMAGGLGVSYGAQGLYASVTGPLNAGASGDWGPVQTMTEGAQQPGAGRFKFLKRAVEGLLTKGTRLSALPERGMLTADPSRVAPGVVVAGFKDAVTEEYLVHFKKRATVHPLVSLRVDGIDGQAYRVVQVNLRSGVETSSTVTASQSRIPLPAAGVGPGSTHKNYLMVVRKQ